MQLSEFEGFLASTLQAPVAGDGFRAHVREDFLGQASGSETPEASPLIPSPRGTTEPRATLESRDSERATPGQGRKLHRFLVLAAAAAALIFVTFLLPDEPRWEVVGITREAEAPGEGVSGEPLGTGTPIETQTVAADIQRRVNQGERLEGLVGTLDLDLEGWLHMRVACGTDIEFPELPVMGSTDPLTFVLREGEIFLETLPAYPGNPIRIRTPDALVHVTGTGLGVLVDAGGTCTCVEHGVVWVAPLAERGLERLEAEEANLAASTPRNARPRTKVTDRSVYQVLRDESMADKSISFEEMARNPKGLMHTEALVSFIVGR